MKQVLLLLGLLLLLSPLGAATLSMDSNPAVDPKVTSLVEQALVQSVLLRLPGSGVLEATLEETKDDAVYQLVLTYGDKHVSLDIGYDPETLYERLLHQLDQEGLALLGEKASPTLQYRLGSGYASSHELEVGYPYWVLDGQDQRVGQVVVTKYHEEKKLSFLTQREGAALGLGMSLAKMSPLRTALAVSLDRKAQPGIDVQLSYALPLYPFSLVAQLGYVQPALFHVNLGLQSMVPLSHLFGTKNLLARTLSVGALALVGLGLGSDTDVYLRSVGMLFLSCQLGSWSVQLGGGNRVGANSQTRTEEGLFFSVGTAYTYTP
jgi:hypothetical protein